MTALFAQIYRYWPLMIAKLKLDIGFNQSIYRKAFGYVNLFIA
jgi:hypothetical protein